MREITKSGVEILSGWKIFELINNSGENLIIKSLKIKSNLEIKEIACDILINFSKKSVPLKNFLGKIIYLGIYLVI